MTVAQIFGARRAPLQRKANGQLFAFLLIPKRVQSRHMVKETLASNGSGLGQFENRFGTQRHVARDDAVPVNEVGDRRGEHGVAAGDFPLALEHNRKRQAVLLTFARFSDGSPRLIIKMEISDRAR